MNHYLVRHTELIITNEYNIDKLYNEIDKI